VSSVLGSGAATKHGRFRTLHLYVILSQLSAFTPCISCISQDRRLMTLDCPSCALSTVQETWISQAAAQQRRGRAGRVRPGVCFRLFSRATWATLQAWPVRRSSCCPKTSLNAEHEISAMSSAARCNAVDGNNGIHSFSS